MSGKHGEGYRIGVGGGLVCEGECMGDEPLTLPEMPQLWVATAI